MCGVWEHCGPDRWDDELRPEEWERVITDAARLGTRLISITGGEPLLYQGWERLIATAKRHDISIHLCTNGTMLTDENIVRLKESGVDSVSVSLESDQREIHEELRGIDTFKKVIAGLKRLKEQAPEIQVGINYLITAKNFRNLDRMVDFAETLGVDQIKFAPIHTNLQHKNKCLADYNQLLFTKEHMLELKQELERLLAALRRTRLMSVAPGFLNGVLEYYQYGKRPYCYAGHLTCAVNPHGFVTPCCDHEGEANVRNQSLTAIWRSPEFALQRQKVVSCTASCWDTTNVELSIRLRPLELVRGWRKTLQEIEFYFRGRNR